MAVIERIYTVPLTGAYRYRRRNRAVRSMALLKEFLARHMKSNVENVRLDAGLNDYLWSHGMTKPPRRVKVKVKKGDDGTVDVYLLEDAKEAKEAKPKAKAPKKKAEKKPSTKEASSAKQKEVKEVNAEKKEKGEE